MKKILSILIIALMLVSAVSITAFAEEQYTVKGKWYFDKDTLIGDKSVSSDTNIVDEHFNFTYSGNNKLYYGIQIKKQTSNFNTYVYKEDGSLGDLALQDYFNWNTDGYFDFGSTPQNVSNQFYNWLTTYLYQLECDGSSCSVADWDIDGTCDTCGSPLAYGVMRSYRPSSWPALEFPNPPLGSDDNSHYLIITKPDEKTYLYVFTPYAESPVATWDTTGNPNDRIQIRSLDVNGNSVSVVRNTYILNETVMEWSHSDSQSVSSTLVGSFSSTVHYSTLTLKNADGTTFFPLPLWEIVEQITEGETAVQKTKIIQTMALLTACGIGLMALLIILILLRKKSLLFLKK